VRLIWCETDWIGRVVLGLIVCRPVPSWPPP